MRHIFAGLRFDKRFLNWAGKSHYHHVIACALSALLLMHLLGFCLLNAYHPKFSDLLFRDGVLLTTIGIALLFPPLFAIVPLDVGIRTYLCEIGSHTNLKRDWALGFANGFMWTPITFLVCCLHWTALYHQWWAPPYRPLVGYFVPAMTGPALFLMLSVIFYLFLDNFTTEYQENPIESHCDD